MRCPSCGATNPDEARWCGQCYSAFTEPEPESESSPTVEPEAAARPRSAGPGDGATDEVTRSGFRKTDDTLEWRCATCGEFNSIDVLTCAICGTSFAARYGEAEPESSVNWTAATALSVVLPGTGHYLAGRPGAGIARAFLFVVWLTGGLLLLATAGTSAALAAAPLLLGALVVWAGTLADLPNLRRGGSELLSGRPLLWLVVVVTGLLLLGAFAGAGRLT